MNYNHRPQIAVYIQIFFLLFFLNFNYNLSHLGDSVIILMFIIYIFEWVATQKLSNSIMTILGVFADIF